MEMLQAAGETARYVDELLPTILICLREQFEQKNTLYFLGT